MTTDTRSTSRLRHDPLVHGLGRASALLGVPQVAAPAGFARALGVVGHAPRHRSAAPAAGVRELAAATGLLGRPHPVRLWARVGGDLMDLTPLARASKNHNGRGHGTTVAATAAVTGITAAVVYAAARARKSTPMELTAVTTVTRSPDEAYTLWKDLERLPDFMVHLDEVHVTGPRTSHWRASAPFGKTVEWDAEITQDVPGQLIAWRSLDGADIDNSGDVRFVPAPGGRGTEIRVSLRYQLPGGAVGKAAARYFGEEPHQQLDDDLRRFKQIAEIGEVVRSEGAPGGKRARGEFPQHPARPLTEDELKEALS
ncbi:SRPBCC family protein [Streptomyces sp. NPDC046859]|uniref:SRPBCC family protein n=1 Tax=Streptomyces sp. NPDC046859 TaxID=3155734 RepID=UPI0033C92EBE